MLSRREVIRSGLAAAAMGLLSRRGPAVAFGQAAQNITLPTFPRTAPLRLLGLQEPSVMMHGFPFSPWFTGDNFDDRGGYPFHALPECCKTTEPPEPTETVDVAVVGGGLSGLAAAYLLRARRPVVLELHAQFGGNASGETWQDTSYSMGSAYFITPDPGSFLWDFYHELGLDRVVRYSAPGDPVELHHQVHADFWTGAGLGPEASEAFRRYAEVVTTMADESYPEIPLPEGKDNQWIIDLDRVNFLADLEGRMGIKLPPLLQAAVQGYFYSSFGAGMEDISAAGGWNFLAAEEFGRWVLPGGNAYLSQRMWQALAQVEKSAPSAASMLRASVLVVDVRLRGEAVQVTYADASGTLHSLLARYVVAACPKHVAKHILHDLDALDPEKRAAMAAMKTCAYLVANVLLDSPVALDFYDLFLLGDENYPVDPAVFGPNPIVTDVVSGHYARRRPSPRSVLTLYWPLVYPNNIRPTLLVGDMWDLWTGRLAKQLGPILDVLRLSRTAVRQIRLSRWGHAFPIAVPNFIADGLADAVRRPIAERIFFANQDNWALPAVENSLLDARTAASAIDELL